MEAELAALRARLDRALDTLTAAQELGESALLGAFLSARAAAEAAFEAEELAFGSLGPEYADEIAKMRAQHEYAREAASAVMDASGAAELHRLVSQFRAIAQHNLIEEQRDVFRQ
jgi:hypothetical protein